VGRGLRIKKIARERGVTLSSIAKELDMPRSNISAIASGARGVSLKVLQKISRVLDCSLDELALPGEDDFVFKDKRVQSLLDVVESRNYDGIDKTWVDRVMLAQKVHYIAARRKG